jgi:hypothetical protein
LTNNVGLVTGCAASLYRGLARDVINDVADGRRHILIPLAVYSLSMSEYAQPAWWGQGLFQTQHFNGGNAKCLDRVWGFMKWSVSELAPASIVGLISLDFLSLGQWWKCMCLDKVWGFTKWKQSSQEIV